MNLEDYKIIFVVLALIGVLLIATPALISVIHLPGIPGGAKFSELYLLGPNNIAGNYPSTIVVGQNYSVNVGVGNQLGSSAYYVLYVKFANQTDKMPNNALGTASILPPLYEYRFSIQNSKNWESLLTFSVSNFSISGNNSRINTLTLNGVNFNTDKLATLDLTSSTFKYQLLFELWIYNAQSNQIEFNSRYVLLQLNLSP
jgi:uncharacterized membrane protein